MSIHKAPLHNIKVGMWAQYATMITGPYFSLLGS